MAVHHDENVNFIRYSRAQNYELRFSRYRRRTFDKHTHDTYSIGIVKEGRTEFFCRNRTELIRRKEIALINPGEVHACNPQKGSVLTYYMLYVAPSIIQDVSNTLSEVEDSIVEFTTTAVCDDSLYRQLIMLSELISSGRDELEVETVLYETMADIVQCYGNISKCISAKPKGIDKAIEVGRLYLMEHLFQNVSLQELASHTGFSPYHFLREFRKIYGLPPHTYQLQQRVNAAKRMLVGGKPIVDVAAEVGFADQSHFTRKFKAFVGATPRQYQAANR